MIVRYRGLGIFAPMVYVGAFLLLRRPLETEKSWTAFLIASGIAGATTYFLGSWLNRARESDASAGVSRSGRHTLYG
ncbi:MAG TPA: hypothetical protein VGE76_13385, partial [Opitutaceae bacterium]